MSDPTPRPIDVPRCLKAMQNIYVQGDPTPQGRKLIIGEAIGKIQADGSAALRSGYLGIKNYEGFGDQRCDCEYGMGPRHGSIVFSVGRVRSSRSDSPATLGADEIYLLECVRDYGVRDNPQHKEGGDWNDTTTPKKLNLTTVLARRVEAQRVNGLYDAMLKDATVESHEHAEALS